MPVIIYASLAGFGIGGLVIGFACYLMGKSDGRRDGYFDAVDFIREQTRIRNANAAREAGERAILTAAEVTAWRLGIVRYDSPSISEVRQLRNWSNN